MISNNKLESPIASPTSKSQSEFLLECILIWGGGLCYFLLAFWFFDGLKEGRYLLFGATMSLLLIVGYFAVYFDLRNKYRKNEKILDKNDKRIYFKKQKAMAEVFGGGSVVSLAIGIVMTASTMEWAFEWEAFFRLQPAIHTIERSVRRCNDETQLPLTSALAKATELCERAEKDFKRLAESLIKPKPEQVREALQSLERTLRILQHGEATSSHRELEMAISIIRGALPLTEATRLIVSLCLSLISIPLLLYSSARKVALSWHELEIERNS